MEQHKFGNNARCELIEIKFVALTNSSQFQLFRIHLTSIFDHQFPLFFDQIIQNVLVCYSSKRLKPEVLLDLLNSFYLKVNCNKLSSPMNMQCLKLEFRNFSYKQNCLDYKHVSNRKFQLNCFTKSCEFTDERNYIDALKILPR